MAGFMNDTSAPAGAARQLAAWQGGDLSAEAIPQLRNAMLEELRDAHAATALRLRRLWRAAEVVTDAALRHLIRRMREDAEAQHWRLEQAFAALSETPSGGRARAAERDLLAVERLAAAGPAGPGLDRAMAALLAGMLHREATEAGALRMIAHAAGMHLVARLLDLTTGELREGARALAHALPPLAAPRLH
jgi:ferritin-like metal-binding protein YciE